MNEVRTMTFVTLKIVCAMATNRPGFSPSSPRPSVQVSTSWKKTGAATPVDDVVTSEKLMTTRQVPMRLKSAWARAVRRAFAFAPIAASAAVMVVPMLSPSTIGIAVHTEITPDSASAMVMPIVADELCTIIVQSVPTAIAPSTASIGRCPPVGAQSNVEKNAMKRGIFARTFSSSAIRFMPKKRRPKPSTVRHAPRTATLRENISPATPSATAGRATSLRLNETS